jgi:hypothetical protein
MWRVVRTGLLGVLGFVVGSFKVIGGALSVLWAGLFGKGRDGASYAEPAPGRNCCSPGFDFKAECAPSIEKNFLTQMLAGCLGHRDYEKIRDFLCLELYGPSANNGVGLPEILRSLSELSQDRRRSVMWIVAGRCYENYRLGCSGLGLFISSMFSMEGAKEYEDIISEFASVWREAGEAARRERDAGLAPALPGQESCMPPEQQPQRFPGHS